MSEITRDWAGDPNKLAAQLRRTAKAFNPKLLLAQLLRDAADQIDCATTPSQVLDAATVERCAIRDYLTACAAVADTQAERFAGHDASIVAACRAEAKAYLNAARMIEAQDHASRREQITAALATDPHQHGGKGA